ncbi:bacterioferritin [Thiofilum flexile]|uniref:bacterioferritin n=1 Tax=Thiofilum flexile TaxID=125627 RepID=UPI00037A4220|nr:bacterioferritin [Thiofilum flexile]
MRGNPALNQVLNQVLRSQLTAINQYFLHARMCGNWGLDKLNDKEYHRSIKAMKQADTLIARILFLEGLPNLQDLGKLYIGEDVPEIMVNDLRLTTEIIAELRSAIAKCEQEQDYVSRDLLEELLETEEEYVDWLESQEWAIANMGLPNYLQSMM